MTHPKPVSDTSAMISGMTPELQPGVFVFATLPETPEAQSVISEAIAVFREAEGVSVVVPVSIAKATGLSVDMPMRQITLAVYSALDGVGLTAAVSSCLAAEAISCNVIAATMHDHVFVPEQDAERAVAALRRLQGA